MQANFKNTARIWWDPWQGGAGAIWSTIDGSGSGYPIAEVNNCSRIIKYVVTVGQRSNSYTLVDMRIHDVNLVADLTRHDPPAPDPEDPVDYDGTRTPPAYDRARADQEAAQAMDVVDPYWTGPWPLLHYQYSLQLVPSNVPAGHPAFAMAGLTLLVHVAKNILGYVEILDVTTSGDGSFLQPSDPIRSIAYNIIIGLINIDIRLSAYAFEIAAESGCIPALVAATVCLATSIGLLIYEMTTYSNSMIAKGAWTEFDACCFYIFWGALTLLNALGFSVLVTIRNLLYGPNPAQELEEAAAEVKGPSGIFLSSKVALCVLLGISIWCFVVAYDHLVKSF